MKSGQKDKVEKLRFILSFITQEEKDKNKELSDSEIIQILKKALKRNQDSYEQFTKAGILTETRRREFYEKPTAMRKRKIAAATKRHKRKVSMSAIRKKPPYKKF